MTQRSVVSQQGDPRLRDSVHLAKDTSRARSDSDVDDAKVSVGGASRALGGSVVG